MINNQIWVGLHVLKKETSLLSHPKNIGHIYQGVALALKDSLTQSQGGRGEVIS